MPGVSHPLGEFRSPAQVSTSHTVDFPTKPRRTSIYRTLESCGDFAFVFFARHNTVVPCRKGRRWRQCFLTSYLPSNHVPELSGSLDSDEGCTMRRRRRWHIACIPLCRDPNSGVLAASSILGSSAIPNGFRNDWEAFSACPSNTKRVEDTATFTWR